MESPEPILSSAIVLDEFLFPAALGSRSRSRIPQRKQHIDIDGFTEFVKKTFRRYDESNQRIDSFTLRLNTDTYARLGRATEWTLKALKLGATDLTFRSDQPNICIPLQEVVFGNENIVRLCLQRLNIKQLKVNGQCPGLKSLTLSDSGLKLDPLFDIISCCPSVESLSLSNIYAGDNDDDDDYDDDDEHVKSAPPLPAIILPKLRSLVLCCYESKFQIEALFLDDLSSKFPNLKHLTLAVKPSLWKRLEVMGIISSALLETLHIKDMNINDRRRNRVPRVEFDVPSIRKFTFEVDSEYIPDVSFRSTSGHQWEESYVSISDSYACDGLSATWFRQLSNILANLRGSKTHLCLKLHKKEIFDYCVGELDGLNLCEVEDLTLDIEDLPSLNCHALLDGLFRICRPKTITQYAKPPDNNNDDDDDHGGADTRKNDLFICRTLERAMQEKGRLLISTQFMYGLRDLEEINAQQLIDEVWTPQTLESILADVADSTLQKRFRLQLKWKPFVVS